MRPDFISATCSALLVAAMAQQALPAPLAFWTFQEPSGSPRQTTANSVLDALLIDGNATAPIERAENGVFGPYAAFFPAIDLLQHSNNSQRLYAARTTVPGLTAAISGPNATVTMVSWIYRSAQDSSISSEAMVAGVWDEYLKARQYAIFTDLGVCSSAPVYQHGLAAHISPVGGPTPGHKYCVTAACDPAPLPTDAWQCLANVYNGTHISAYLNGTLQSNGASNPYPLTGGIYSPESAGTPGAEFGVGANQVNETVGAPPIWSNVFRGSLGGLGVWSQAFTQEQVAAACAGAAGFEHLAEPPSPAADWYLYI